MDCVELTENNGAEALLSTASNMQGRAWYFATLPPLSATLQALSLGTGTPVIPALSLIWALRVSSALRVRFDGEKQRGTRKKFGSMEGLTTVNSAGLWGVSFPCPSRVLSTPFYFLLILVTSTVYVTATCTTERQTRSHRSQGQNLLAPAPGGRHRCIPVPYFSDSYVMA